MFERFTDRARRVIVVAQDEARDIQDTLIRPEHLLLALIKTDGLAAKALGQAGVEYEAVRDRTRASMADSGRRRARTQTTKLPFSPQAKKVLELSLREALRLGHNYIGTEHLLLGLLREAEAGENSVGKVMGTDAEEVRARLIELVPNGPPGPSLRSPALVAAMDRGRQVAGQAPLTTGHLVTAILADPHSQAAKALLALGTTMESLATALTQVDVADTTDAGPGPGAFEIKVGGVTTSIYDPDLAMALKELRSDQIHVILKRGLGATTEETG
jgi:ATP-dependent Clp protease ATP-binding subunit ClpA